MFTIALLFGLYGYSIFFLGIAGLLYKSSIFVITAFFFLGIVWVCKNNFTSLLSRLRLKKNNIYLALVLVISLQAIINFIGTLGPELGFDALWYHLTLPKLYLINHKIFHIPGGLLYYSDMPKLAEMLFTGGLAFGSDIFPKIIHFSFGILCCFALYKLSRTFFPRFLSLICVCIFYGNLVVGWESITAYVDLVRTFYEIMALWAWVSWFETKNNRWFYLSALMLGFAITTKFLSFGSLIIFIVLTLIAQVNIKEPFKEICKKLFFYILLAILIPLPWLIFSYIHTGDPFFPFFTSVYPIHTNMHLLNPIYFFSDVSTIFTHADDPVSPIYIMIFPLLLITIPKMNQKFRLLGIYSILTILVWYITPRTGGGRFILPYLPAFSVLSTSVIYQKSVLKNILVSLIVFVSLISIIYRGGANAKYLPVIAGKETKAEFLSTHLNFSFGDFYDTDGYFARYIGPKDRVLLIGFHNLYYVAFPFTLNPKDSYDFIAIQNTHVPIRFANWHQIHQNKTTGVIVYAKN